MIERFPRQKKYNIMDKTNVPAGSKGRELYASALANLIEKRLQKNCIGYQFVISYKENVADIRSWGHARLSHDAPARTMSILDQYNIASVAKPITGAALLKLLSKDPNVNRDSKILPYLPSHWDPDKSVEAITFRHLLKHTSGFRTGFHLYADLKSMVEQGVEKRDFGHHHYDNSNYNLMRLIIPKLAGYAIADIPKGIPDHERIAKEKTQASAFANDYMDYVQKKLFNKIELPLLYCKPIEHNPALIYDFPLTVQHGTPGEDYTLLCGSGGWTMSTAQLSTFFRALHHTEKMMPLSISNLMITEDLCYETGTTPKGVTYYEKAGVYNIGILRLNSVIVGFGNGIIVTVIVNSNSPDLEATVRAAFDEWYQ